jgi:hypothetical protein
MFARLRELSEKIAEDNEQIMLATENENQQNAESLKDGLSLTGSEIISTTTKAASVLFVVMSSVTCAGAVAFNATAASLALTVASPMFMAPSLIVAAGGAVVGTTLKMLSVFASKRENDKDWCNFENDHDWVIAKKIVSNNDPVKPIPINT